MVSSVVSSFLESQSDLVEFDSVPGPDVGRLTKLSSSKSCASDPLHALMVKQDLPVLCLFKGCGKSCCSANFNTLEKNE